MSHNLPRQKSAAIEWEELPSLAKRLQRGPKASSNAAGSDSRFAQATPGWGETAPGGLDTVPSSLPFVESLAGLATREVIEPDVFRHFFGPDAD